MCRSKSFFIFLILIFLTTSVSGKIISLCISAHTFEKKISKINTEENSCHKSTNEKKNKLCVECDCYIGSALISDQIMHYNFCKIDIYRHNIDKYQSTMNSSDPPPKEISL